MVEKIPLWMLREWQAKPLEWKVERTLLRIREFHEKMGGKTHISFSGGKDSTVLLHLVRKIYPDTPAVFFDTGIEFPEIHEFVKTIPNVTTTHPRKSYYQIINDYGYPVVSKQIALKVEAVRRTPNNAIARYYTTGYKKNGEFKKAGMISKKWLRLIDAPFKVSWRCCYFLKKAPVHDYEKQFGSKPYIGVMASDSRQRSTTFLQNGCNSFKIGAEQSTPLGFWREEDIWNYIKKEDLSYCKLYNMGWGRTGCMFCLFGCHLEKNPNRFRRMKSTHPKLWEYGMNKLGLEKVLRYMGIDSGRDLLDEYFTPSTSPVVVGTHQAA